MVAIILIKLEARGGFEPPHKGFADLSLNHLGTAPQLERETGFEPATSTLARSHSTAELLPLTDPSIQQGTDGDNEEAFTLPGSGCRALTDKIGNAVHILYAILFVREGQEKQT